MNQQFSRVLVLSLLAGAFGGAPGCGSDSPSQPAGNGGSCAQQNCENHGGMGGEAAGSDSGGASGDTSAGGQPAAGAGGEGGIVEVAQTKPVLVVSASTTNDNAALYAISVDPPGPAQLISHAIPPKTSVVSFSVSPDGARVAFVVNATTLGALDVYVADVDGSNTRKLSPDGLADGMAFVLGWSRSGKSLAFTHDGHYYAARVDGSALLEVPTRDFAWTPNESEVAYADGASVVVVDANGVNPRTLAQSTAPMALEGWSSGGGWLMTAARPKTGPAVQAWPSSGGDMVELPSSHPTEFPSWSPRVDGLYAWVDRLGGAGVASVDGQIDMPFSASGVQRLSWSPDGARIAFSGSELLINPVPFDASSKPVRVVGTSLTGTAPAYVWAPDGQSIVYSAVSAQSQSEDVFVQDIRGVSNSVGVRMSGTATIGSTVRSMGFSPNSRFVSYQADHRQQGTDELAITEVESGRHLVIGKISEIGTPRDGHTWSRDGRFLAFQLQARLTLLDSGSFDSLDLEAYLPKGFTSRAFDFAVQPVR